MKRAIKFLLVFLLTAGIVYALVIGLNYSAFKTLFDNPDGMAEGSEFIPKTYSLKGLSEFIAEQPEFSSITSYNVNDPDSGIFYQSDKMVGLGAISNLFLLMEYERQVADDLLDPKEKIDLSDIEIFALPGISINNHQDLLSEFENETVELDRIVAAMIRNSDLVAADYLWFKLGQDNIDQLIIDLGIDQNSSPLPFSGIYAALNDNIIPVNELETMDPETRRSNMIQIARRLKDDPDFNSRIKTEFDDNRIGLSFMEERDALAYFPQSTTGDLTDVMERLLNGELFDAETTGNIKDKLRWPMGSETIDRSFSDYGGIYDARMGLLAGIDFGTSIYDGHTSVQAVFFEQLPVAFWLHMSSNHMQEDFQQRLIWDPALYKTTIDEIEAANE